MGINRKPAKIKRDSIQQVVTVRDKNNDDVSTYISEL